MSTRERLLCLATLALTCVVPRSVLAADAVADDPILGFTGIASLEFSLDGKHAIWARRNPDGNLVVFYAPVTDNGVIDRANQTNITTSFCEIPNPPPCPECRCGFDSYFGLPQFGASDGGGSSPYFAVYPQQGTGKFVYVIADGADADTAPDEVGFAPDDCTNASDRRSPTPIRNDGSPQKWVAYLVNLVGQPLDCVNRPPNPLGGDCLQLWAVDLDNNFTACSSDHELLYDEWRAPSAATALESAWFRWAESTNLLFHGNTHVEAQEAPPGGIKAVIARQEFLGGFPTGKHIVTTNDEGPAPYDAVDHFPRQDTHLIFGKDVLDDSEVWVPGMGTEYIKQDGLSWVASNDTEIASGNAFGAQSFEAFVWGQDTYVAYNILDDDGQPHDFGRLPYAYEGEIWVQKLDDPNVNCVVSEVDGSQSAHFEPEPIVRNNVVRIYYNEGAPEDDVLLQEFNVRAITITDKATFDTQCEAGNVWGF